MDNYFNYQYNKFPIANLKEKLIYLDSASTSKIDRRVLEKMLPYLVDYYANASSKHKFGQYSKDAIEDARKKVSHLINSNHKDIIFTSGSTESINIALKGYTESNSEKGNHIITVKTEHKAVLSTCKYLETKGYEITYLDVDENGLISIKELKNSIKHNTLLIVVMYVNNETGVIQPIREIGRIAKKMSISLFCDATQAIGRLPINVETDNIDMLCFSAHKINGPKGAGVLYKKNNIEITPLIHGGNQENGYRSGTYNTHSIVGLGKACELLITEMESNVKQVIHLNNYLINSLKKSINFKEISKKEFRVPNILNLIIPDLNSNIFIDKHSSLAISNGSACNSQIIEESHVITSMLGKEKIKDNYLRISIDKYNTEEDIDTFIELIKNYLKIKN